MTDKLKKEFAEMIAEFMRNVRDEQSDEENIKQYARDIVDDMEMLLQSENAVEVVRCKDCVKDGMTVCPISYIEKQTLCFVNHSPDFFCGAGERKTP